MKELHSDRIQRDCLLTRMNRRGLVKGTAKAPDIAEEDISIMFSTNVTGLINMTQAILPIFKRRDEGGRGDIINIGSIAGREGYPGGSIYCATKAAIRTFTDAMRRELIATRIRVMEVSLIFDKMGFKSQNTTCIRSRTTTKTPLCLTSEHRFE